MSVGRDDRTGAQLRLYCYLMLASYEDAELTLASVLRLGQDGQVALDPGARRSSLFRDAVRACAGLVERAEREPRVAEGSDRAPVVAVPWLQPYPDRYLDDTRSDGVPVARESVELAFVAALQRLPVRQRAALVLGDALGWSDDDIGEVLDGSATGVRDEVRAGRSALRENLPGHQDPADRRAAEKVVLERYMRALQQADDLAVGGLLQDDAWCAQQQGAGGNETAEPGYFRGRDVILDMWAPALHGDRAVDFEFIPFWMNRQPGAATYVRMRNAKDSAHQPFGLTALHVEGGTVAGVEVFTPDLFPTFGLPGEV